jgi:hypothetical protein
MVMLAISMPSCSVSAGKKPEYVYVSGWLVEISVSTHTFILRHTNKLLQFTAIPSRTNVTVDGRGSLQTSLGSARIGDAVMGKVWLEESRPYLDSVEFTHRPATAIPIKSKPGFVLNPYSNAVFDASKADHGEMVQDGVDRKNLSCSIIPGK